MNKRKAIQWLTLVICYVVLAYTHSPFALVATVIMTGVVVFCKKQ